MARQPGPERRQFPRYPTRHRVEGESLDSGIAFRGTLQDFSAAGCYLCLDRHLPLGARIELRCDINGLGLQIRGRVVWAEATAAGVFHGIAPEGRRVHPTDRGRGVATEAGADGILAKPFSLPELEARILTLLPPRG